MNLSDEVMMLGEAWISECLWLLSITTTPAVPANAYLPGIDRQRPNIPTRRNDSAAIVDSTIFAGVARSVFRSTNDGDI